MSEIWSGFKAFFGFFTSEYFGMMIAFICTAIVALGLLSAFLGVL